MRLNNEITREEAFERIKGGGKVWTWEGPEALVYRYVGDGAGHVSCWIESADPGAVPSVTTAVRECPWCPVRRFFSQSPGAVGFVHKEWLSPSQAQKLLALGGVVQMQGWARHNEGRWHYSWKLSPGGRFMVAECVGEDSAPGESYWPSARRTLSESDPPMRAWIPQDETEAAPSPGPFGLTYDDDRVRDAMAILEDGGVLVGRDPDGSAINYRRATDDGLIEEGGSPRGDWKNGIPPERAAKSIKIGLGLDRPRTYERYEEPAAKSARGVFTRSSAAAWREDMLQERLRLYGITIPAAMKPQPKEENMEPNSKTPALVEPLRRTCPACAAAEQGTTRRNIRHRAKRGHMLSHCSACNYSWKTGLRRRRPDLAGKKEPSKALGVAKTVARATGRGAWAVTKWGATRGTALLGAGAVGMVWGRDIVTWALEQAPRLMDLVP